MRSWLVAAAVVAVFGVVLLRGVSRAEPPPAMESRPIAQVTDALKKTPALRSELATVRFAAEVFDEATVSAPIGSALTTLGPWSDNGPLLKLEGRLSPAELSPLKKKAASALLKEFGASLPLSLRAFTLAQEGKKKESLATWLEFAKQQTITSATCPSEHPMYSARRASRLESVLTNAAPLASDAELAPVKKALERAKACWSTNMAVG